MHSVRGRRALSALCSAALLAATASCGAPAGTGVVLNWYVAPDRVDVQLLAETCSAESGGEYRVIVKELPEDAGDRHREVMRRMFARDDSIDILTADLGQTAELAAAEVLAPIPDALSSEFSADLFPNALEGASDVGELVGVPWWIDPYLMWFTTTAALETAIDVSQPVP